MAEFIIKRNSATNIDTTKNIRGCYKRGDIIDICSDGETSNKPHLTVLKVPGLSVRVVQTYKSERIETIQKTERIRKDEYDNLKTKSASVLRDIGYIKINEPKATFGISDNEKTYEVDVEVLDVYERRKYQIPEEEMNIWFGNNNTAKELSILEWNNFKTKIKDKQSGDGIYINDK